MKQNSFIYDIDNVLGGVELPLVSKPVAGNKFSLRLVNARGKQEKMSLIGWSSRHFEVVFCPNGTDVVLRKYADGGPELYVYNVKNDMLYPNFGYGACEIGYSPDTGEFLVQRIDNTLRPSGIPWIVKDGMVVGRSDKINTEIRFAASDDMPNAKIMTKNDVAPRHSGFADIANISHENRLNVTHAKNPNGGTDVFVNGKLLTQNNTGLKFICGFINGSILGLWGKEWRFYNTKLNEIRVLGHAGLENPWEGISTLYGDPDDTDDRVDGVRLNVPKLNTEIVLARARFENLTPMRFCDGR